MKNYYQILGVEPKSSEDEIRRAYRRMALQYHPDRNPGDPKSEDRFKEVSEAYGVLIDRDKRRDFDLWRERSENIRTSNQGAYTYARNETFKYTQEEIFRDLFRDQRNTGLFRDLFREFEKAGFRFDKRFLDHVLFGGRGIIFGGIFTWGGFDPTRTWDGRPQEDSSNPKPIFPQKPGILERLGQGIGRHILKKRIALPKTEKSNGKPGKLDLQYHLTIDPEQAEQGTEVQIAVDRNGTKEKLKVVVPPGTKSGTRLRLKGKGIPNDLQEGDLYLRIHVS